MGCENGADLVGSLERFGREGYVLIRGALSEREVAALRAVADRAVAEEEPKADDPRIYPARWRHGPPWEDMIDHPSVIDLVEELLAAPRVDNLDIDSDEARHSCHMVGMNLLTARHGGGYAEKWSSQWHVDGWVFLPRDEDIRWDARIPFPVFLVTAEYILTDPPAGGAPLEVVPGSHKSGRRPEPGTQEPAYEGRGPRRVRAEAGDCILFASTLWHRMADPGEGRLALQVHYGARFMGRNLGPSATTIQVPDDLLERSSPRRRRLLGEHPGSGPFS